MVRTTPPETLAVDADSLTSVDAFALLAERGDAGAGGNEVRAIVAPTRTPGRIAGA